MRLASPRFVALAVLAAFPAGAPAAEEAWEHDFVLYLLGAGLDGESQVGPVVTSIDASFSDILESLEMGAMGAYRAQKGPLAITFDAMFVALSADQTGTAGVTLGADIDQLIVGADLAYAVGEGFELLAGARYNSLDVQLQGVTPGGAAGQIDGEEDWIDPYVGARVTASLGEKWAFVLRGDVGGFGVGSDLAWNAVARFDCALSERSSLLFGYRILDVDYETGSGLNLFRYDMATSGPIIGFAWRS